MLFDSFIDLENEILFEVEKKQSFYKFQGFLKSITEDDKKETVQNDSEDYKINVCISNEADLTMKMTKALMIKIKEALCTDTSKCETRSELSQHENLSFEILMKDHLKTNKFFQVKFYLKSFYQVLKNGQIIWKINNLSEKEEESGCEIILEQEFIKKTHLFISNNLENSEHLLMGFKFIEKSDYPKFDFYTISMIILTVTAISLLIVFIMLNNSLNKLIEKEEKEEYTVN